MPHCMSYFSFLDHNTEIAMLDDSNHFSYNIFDFDDNPGNPVYVFPSDGNIGNLFWPWTAKAQVSAYFLQPEPQDST